jgi:hypothetical protein
MEAIPSRKRDELRKALTNVLERLDLYGMPAAWREEPDEFVIVGRHAGYNNSVYRCTVTCRITDLGRGVRVEMDPDDRRVHYVYNRIGMEKAKEDAQAGKAQPAFTEERAVDEALRYVRAIRGGLPEVHEKPGVRYWHEYGHWNVVYCRRYKGEACMGETISVSFSEKYGLLSFSDSCHTRIESLEVKISKEQAFAIARGYLQERAKKESRWGSFEPVGDPPLCIFAPCVYEFPDPRKPVDDEWLHKGHLVYIVRTANKAEPEWYHLRVFVDAQTGEVVSAYPAPPVEYEEDEAAQQDEEKRTVQEN